MVPTAPSISWCSRAASELGFVALLFTAAACARRPQPPHAPAQPLAQLEDTFGPLIGASNEPTPDQHGTGDRIGLFRQRGGTLWGLPLTISEQGEVLGCAPQGLLDAPVTDALPVDTTDVVGAMNSPTGWRGGTGKLELLLRSSKGAIRWQTVAGAVSPGPVCWAYQVPGLQRPLHYYRLALAAP